MYVPVSTTISFRVGLRNTGVIFIQISRSIPWQLTYFGSRLKLNGCLGACEPVSSLSICLARSLLSSFIISGCGKTLGSCLQGAIIRECSELLPVLSPSNSIAGAS